MRTIHKYPLWVNEAEPCAVMMPEGAKGIHVSSQPISANAPVLWCDVETENKPVIRRFYIYGTGWEIDPRHSYLGTVQIGHYVWHVYEEGA